MYAIINIGDKQFKINEGSYLYTPTLQGQKGDTVSFDQILLIDDGNNIAIGQPILQGKTVTGKILEQVKDDKVIVFKKKRRKGYKKKQGHRQGYTKIMIESITK